MISHKQKSISDSAFKEVISDPTISDLTEDDKDFIYSSFNAKMYNYVIEYVFNKAVKKLKDTVFSLGDELVVNLIHWIDRTFISNFFDVFVLRLACDLDLISKEEKLIILDIIEYLQGKKDSFIETEDINKERTKFYISNLYESIIKKDFSNEISKIKSIIDLLQTTNILPSSEEYLNIVSAINKHKNILLRLIFAMIKTEIANDNKRLKTLSQNFINLIEDLWDKTSLNDKKFYSYYLKTLPEDSAIYKIFMSGFCKVKLIDFTTDLSVVTAILKNCQDILSCHYSIHNQKDETDGLIKLNELNSYPRYFLRSVITPSLVCYLGNCNGYLPSSREVAGNILEEISTEKWIYYFKNFFKQDDFVLMNLIGVDDCIKDFCQVIKKSGISENDFEDDEIKQFLSACKSQDFEQVQTFAYKIYFKDY